MTAVPRRRTKFTIAGFAVGVVGLIAVGALAYAGVENLADSRAGRIVSPSDPGLPVQRLPYTHTALVGTVDDDGWLTSVAVFALEPDGTGGSIVSMSPSGDAASGNTDHLAPLNAVYAVDGPAELLAAAEGLTGLSFDVAEILDAERFAALTMPLGEFVVELPTELRDASTGRRHAAGVARMSPTQAGAAIASRDPQIADWLLDRARAAVWAGVADAVGAGVGSAELSADVAESTPRSLDEFVSRLFAGRVEHRLFSTKEIVDTRVADELNDSYRAAFRTHADTAVSVVTHDRAELLMVLGAIAPGRLGAPHEGPTVRIVSRFHPDDLEPLGLNNADVARQAINRLLFAKVNVVSFGQTDAPPELTIFEVSDASSADDVDDAYGSMFGESDVRVADSLIEGVDLQITLGSAYLGTVESAE